MPSVRGFPIARRARGSSSSTIRLRYEPCASAIVNSVAEEFRLSEREREVFVLIGRGLTNAEIAQELFLSESTVKAHVGRVLAKLGAATRVQAVIRAYELGVVG